MYSVSCLFTFQQKDCRVCQIPTTRYRARLPISRRTSMLTAVFLWRTASGSYVGLSWHCVKSNMSKAERSPFGQPLNLTCRHSHQSYPSQSWSPSELRYVSNCAAKAHNLFKQCTWSSKFRICNLTIRTKLANSSLKNECYTKLFLQPPLMPYSKDVLFLSSI